LVELSSPGYEPWGRLVRLFTGSTQPLTAALRDIGPPAVRVTGLPPRLEQGSRLLIQATAVDNESVSSLALWIDGQCRAETAGEPLSYSWDTSTAAPGEYLVRVEARDPAGNVGHYEARLELVAAVAPGSGPVPAEQPSPTPSRSAPSPVTIRSGRVTLSTYQYRQALWSDAASPAYPYPALDHSRVGPPLPEVYETVILENEYLRLVFLPALGGRLYQCVFLPTGQNLFYNNPAIKPSHWGPPEMGWWLAAGGLEWCLPVDEHGYVTAEPWSVETAHRQDGGATITLTHTEQTRKVRAAVTVTLLPGQASFAVSSRLENLEARPARIQYWLNAMISPGSASLSPATQFLLPASEVVVHSTGDGALGTAHTVLPWPVTDGRDLSRYDNWRDWLGVFAPAATAGYMGAYSPETGLGVARIFPREQAPGVKLFAFGQGFGDAATYTDDGSQYAELWGGLTPTFWDWATLPAHGSLEWTETWFPVHGLGGLSAASAEAALVLTRDGADVRLGVATPRPRDLIVTLTDATGEIYRQACAASPHRPFVTTVRPPRPVDGHLLMQVWGKDAGLLVEHALR
jgi:hypothetical protein